MEITPFPTLPIADGEWFPLALKQDAGRKEFSGSIAAGYEHSLFLKDDGSLWAMGNEGNGRLGNGESNWNANSTPVQVVDSGVAQVAAGYYHSSSSRRMVRYGPWGTMERDNSGMGIGPINLRPFKSWILGSPKSPPEIITHSSSRRMVRYGRWVTMDTGNSGMRIGPINSPVQIVDSGVAQVAAGNYHSLFLKEDGSLWAMGNNGYGQLGNGNWSNQSSPVQIVDSGVAQVAASYEHSLFLKEDGSLWAMGYNGYGQLGNGNWSNQSTPVQVVDSGVVQVAAGYYHSLFLKEDGSLWAMGTMERDNSGMRIGYINLRPFKSWILESCKSPEDLTTPSSSRTMALFGPWGIIITGNSEMENKAGMQFHAYPGRGFGSRWQCIG